MSLARSVWRKTIPATFRRKVWDGLARDYFDRLAIKAAVAYVRTSQSEPTDNVKRLISILEKDDYRPASESIKNQLGLDLQASSHQDLIAYLYFNGKSSGTFIDIGAYDGIDISNTLALEQLGWQGICVEPIPEIYALLDENRKCYKVNAAIASTPSDTARFLKVSDQPGLSGLEHQMPERIRNGLKKQGLEVQNTTVSTMTFEDLMEKFPGFEQVDFLSIDVEGAEVDVLNSIDFDKHRFGLITIENNAGSMVLRDYLSQRGYELFVDLVVDLMFVPAQASAK